MENNPWQPTLLGSTFTLRPMESTDFEELYLAASDPEIWKLHPVVDRYKREKFEIYFQTGMASQGGLVLIDSTEGKIKGASRFSDHNKEAKCIEIGYTFLARSHWGGHVNRELKTLMLNHAFQYVSLAEFVVGVENLRSRRAMEKLGAKELRVIEALEPEGDLRRSVVYGISKDDWFGASRQ